MMFGTCSGGTPDRGVVLACHVSPSLPHFCFTLSSQASARSTGCLATERPHNMDIADIPLDKAELLSVILEALLYGKSC